MSGRSSYGQEKRKRKERESEEMIVIYLLVTPHAYQHQDVLLCQQLPQSIQFGDFFCYSLIMKHVSQSVNRFDIFAQGDERIC